MIKITLNNLIYIVPDLINLFLSGFIFMVVYNWLNNKKCDVSILSIWSLFVSYIIKSICSVVHSLVLTQMIFGNSFKILIYIFVGTIIATFATWVKKWKIIQKLLYFTNNKSINDDIFDDIIDYDRPTMMQIHLRSSNVYYIGKFFFREENGINSWLALINYISIENGSNNVLYQPDSGDIKSVVIINLKDIERIELIYEDDSEVWGRLSGKKIQCSNQS